MLLENQICQAAAIIAEKIINSANYDKTILALIVSLEDETTGKYKVKYLGSSFFAYANPDSNFSKGTNVYILVPGNDMTKEKTILGSTKKIGSNYINIISEESNYNYIGNNCIKSSGSFDLCSYKTEVKVLYDIDSKNNLILVDTSGLEEYIKNAAYIMIGATFRTALPPEQLSKGNYGIHFVLSYEINTEEGKKISNNYDYIIDIDKITGNPYNLTLDTEIKVFFPNLQNATFMGIQKIEIFDEKFPNLDETKDNDIFIKDILLLCANQFTAKDATSYTLKIVTPQGTVFDEKNLSDKILKAQILAKLKALNLKDEKVLFYWFKENPSVLSGNDLYNSYGGKGWECLNDSKFVNTAEEGQPELFNKVWISAPDNYIIKKEDITTFKLTYKCVAIIDNNTLSAIVDVINKDAFYKLELISNLTDNKYTNIDNTTITCNVSKKEGNSWILQDIKNYTFSWATLNSLNTYTSIEAISEEKKNLVNLEMKNFPSYVEVKCYVGGIGTASIFLSENQTNSGQDKYLLVIENGDRVFQYDELGISPFAASSTNELAGKIDQLSFFIFDNETGQKIEGKDIKQALWFVPSEDTLLTLNVNKEEEILKDEKFRYIIDGSTLSYSINDAYSLNKQNNTIELKVKYKDLYLFDHTNFTFVKLGDPGTNGTTVVAKIVPNVENLKDNYVYFPTIVNNNSNNFFAENNSKWFKTILYDGNVQVPEPLTEISGENIGNYSYFFEIVNLKYGYSDGFITLSNYNLNFEYEEIDLVDIFDGIDGLSNILKANISYNKKNYYAFLPIASIQQELGYRIKIKENSGFKYVSYRSDGKNPNYNLNNFFELEVYSNSNNIYGKEEEEITSTLKYEWKTVGGYYEEINEDIVWTNKPDLTIASAAEIRPYQINITAESFITGEITSNAVMCKITTEAGELVGYVHIPVHTYINNYNLGAINGWDGNSILLDEEGGFILSPQMGAGLKNDKNLFSGVVMGAVKESNNTTNEPEIGLMGYCDGVRSFFLNSKDGSATFGKPNSSLIIIDPKDNEAIIKSGNYKPGESGMMIDLSTPSIEYGNGNFSVDSEGILNANGANINGEFHLLTSDETTSVDFDDDGISMYYENEDGDIFSLTETSLVIGHYEDDEEDPTLKVFVGLDYSGETLYISGEIVASSGEIGGWLIKEDRIEATEGCLVLYADGRIEGLQTENGTTGWMISKSEKEKTEIGAGLIKFSSVIDYDKDKWRLEGYIYTYDKSTLEYDNINFRGGLTLSSKGTRPVLFATNKKIVFALMPPLNDRKGYIYFPVSKSVPIVEKDENGNVILDENGDPIPVVEKDEEGNVILDENGDPIVKNTKVIRNDGTRIDYKTVASRDFIFNKKDVNEGEGKTGLNFTEETSLTKILNDAFGYPKRIVYETQNETTDIITEYWEKEIEVPIEGDPDNSITEKAEIKKVFSLEIKDRDKETEEVVSITTPSGLKILLEGFGGL